MKFLQSNSMKMEKEENIDTLMYLMDDLEEFDKLKIEEMAEHIRIKEKYEMLAKRGSYAND